MIKKVNKNKFGVIEYLVENIEDLKSLPKKDTDNTTYAIMRKGNEKLIYLYSSSAKEWVLINEDLSSIKSSLDNLESEVNELKEGNINIDLPNYATKTELSLKVDKVTGKSLISDSEIERLSTLKNYDDSNIRSQLNDIENEIDELKEGNIEIDLTNYVTKNELSTKADKTELHSHTNKTVLDGISSAKVSEWNNKSTFSGNYNDLTNKPTIPTLNGYATEQYVSEEIKKIDVTEQLTDYAKKSELHSHSNKTVLDGITTSKISEWNNKSTFNGDYNDLTNKPTIPTKTSQLTNNSGFITSIPSEYVTETELNTKIDNIKNDILDGKSFKYLTQQEYNNISEAEKNNENIVYCITDKAEPTFSLALNGNELSLMKDNVIISSVTIPTSSGETEPEEPSGGLR